MPRNRTAITLLQATEKTPALAKLIALTRDSQALLNNVEALIPPMLRNVTTAGPIEGDEWCLLVQSNAAAAKMRNLTPSLLAKLRSNGWRINKIRLKVQANFNDVAS